ncbi:MAG: YigZ family protein [Clostridia bacterium]|nr:YigZ family protein [Clostridia bacterium]
MSSEYSSEKLYTTLLGEGTDTYEEKRSEFIGVATHIDTETDALTLIKRIKSEHYDARHNVYAYVCSSGNVQRYSDDGEPQGTAGIPVLDVIRKSGLEDVCVVVTRYFGGTLLGAGGLVRAYTAAAKMAIDKAGIVTYENFSEFRMELSYSDYQKILAKLPNFNAKIDNTDFGETVTLDVALRSANEEKFLSFVKELFYDKIQPIFLGKRFDKE